MFYVFGIHGPMHHGGADRLSHITAVRGVQRPSGLRAGASGVEGREASTRQAAPSLAARSQGAIAAYRGTEQGPHEERHRIFTVSDVMTRGAVTVTPGMRVEQAWQLLSQQKIGQAPVLNAQGVVVGLLLRADLPPAALQAGATEPAAAPAHSSMAVYSVAQVMVTPVPTVAEDTDLRQLTHVLLETGLPGLPVTDAAGTLNGFVSRTDILRAVVSQPPLDLWS